jgi:hypothetical protein
MQDLEDQFLSLLFSIIVFWLNCAPLWLTITLRNLALLDLASKHYNDGVFLKVMRWLSPKMSFLDCSCRSNPSTSESLRISAPSFREFAQL